MVAENLEDPVGTEIVKVGERLGQIGDRLMFDCPGCGFYHQIPIGEGAGPRWHWNGNADLPTFSPSLDVKWKERGEQMRCHSYITDGQIMFLADCTHDKKGQTVPLPAWE